MKKLSPEEEKQFQDMDKKLRDAEQKAGILTEEEKKQADERQKKVMEASASAGVEFAAAVIISTFIGIWIDKEFGTAPVFMLIFIILGGVVAFYNLYRASENLNTTPKITDSQLHKDEKHGKKARK